MVRRNVSLLAVPSFLYRLVRQVEEKTGYAVALTEQDALGYDQITRFATPRQPYHEISYIPAYRDYAVHFFTTGLRKILRFWELPPEERLVPVTQAGQRLPDPEHAEVVQRIPAAAGIDVEDLSRFLYEGTVRQLISVPGDLRVEQEIAAQIPEHRDDQRSYLLRQIKDLEEHFAPEIAAFAPRRVYQAVSAMNIVLAEVASDIAGVDFPTYTRASPHRPLAGQLRSRLDAVEEPGYRGDRKATDAWAEELDMESWFDWLLVEDLD